MATRPGMPPTTYRVVVVALLASTTAYASDFCIGMPIKAVTDRVLAGDAVIFPKDPETYGFRALGDPQVRETACRDKFDKYGNPQDAAPCIVQDWDVRLKGDKRGPVKHSRLRLLYVRTAGGPRLEGASFCVTADVCSWDDWTPFLATCTPDPEPETKPAPATNKPPKARGKKTKPGSSASI